jgi:hypothetical protein
MVRNLKRDMQLHPQRGVVSRVMDRYLIVPEERLQAHLDDVIGKIEDPAVQFFISHATHDSEDPVYHKLMHAFTYAVLKASLADCAPAKTDDAIALLDDFPSQRHMIYRAVGHAQPAVASALEQMSAILARRPGHAKMDLLDDGIQTAYLVLKANGHLM